MCTMASLRAFIGLTTAALLVQAVFGVDHAVGGANGWSLTTDLKSWASTQSFKVGDTLTFSYDSQHSIVEVAKPEYDACSMSKSIQSFTGGNTGVKLSSPGKRYFICGTVGHCTGGMKVEINTVSAAVSAPPPASPPVTPPVTLTPTSPSKAPVVPPPITLTPTSPSKAPMVPPPTAPSTSQSGPSLSPSTTKSPMSAPVMTPTLSPSAAPASDLPGITPPPQRSAANSFSSAAKIGLGLATGMLMALVL